MKDDGLLTLAEAAQRLGLREGALRRAIKRGELPAMKVCSRIRIDPNELLRWIEDQRITGVAVHVSGPAAAELHRGEAPATTTGPTTLSRPV
jgi:excisionase family DNA binding protein